MGTDPSHCVAFVRRRGVSVACAGGACAAAPIIEALTGRVPTAMAHELVPGLRGFPSLLLHAFAAAETVLVLAAAALVLGRARAMPPWGTGVVLVVAGAVIGAALQRWALLLPGLWRWPLVMALGLGGMAVAGVTPGSRTTLVIAFATSATIALGVPPEGTGLPRVIEAGAAVSAAVLAVMLVIALPLHILRRHEAIGLGCRIGGAWVAAIAIMVLAAAPR